jgi:3-deoxy-manno-octulosonate cytidylyltransferase (CMP-KDO synthetase)
MTSEEHRSGTDRCAEAVERVEHESNTRFDVVLNIQGDEPFIAPEQLELLKTCFQDENTRIATLVKTIKSQSELSDPNRPKVVLNRQSEAIYFSRSIIPYVRGISENKWIINHSFFIHIGLYGFQKRTLLVIPKLPQFRLVIVESLEQLRWIEHGYRIATRITEYESFGVDTPQDLERLSRL